MKPQPKDDILVFRENQVTKSKSNIFPSQGTAFLASCAFNGAFLAAASPWRTASRSQLRRRTKGPTSLKAGLDSWWIFCWKMNHFERCSKTILCSGESPHFTRWWINHSNIFKPFLLHHSRENYLMFEWCFVGAPFEGFWFENEVMIFSKGPAPGSKFKTFGWGRTLWLVPQSYNQLVSTGVSSNSLPLPSSQGSTKCACRKDAPHSGLPATEEMVRSSYSLIDMEIWTGFPWKVITRLSPKQNMIHTPSQLIQVIPAKVKSSSLWSSIWDVCPYSVLSILCHPHHLWDELRIMLVWLAIRHAVVI